MCRTGLAVQETAQEVLSAYVVRTNESWDPVSLAAVTGGAGDRMGGNEGNRG